MKKIKIIHPEIKKQLGYHVNMPDREFLKAWKKQSTHVCKPCWELRYCPYGPFVEQSPLLPSTKKQAIAHNDHIKAILKSGYIGTATPLDALKRKKYAQLIATAKKDPVILAERVHLDLFMSDLIKLAKKEGKALMEYFTPPLSDFEHYKVPYPFGMKEKINVSKKLQSAINREIKRMEKAIATGVNDERTRLDDARRASFEKEVASFNPDEYPDEIPQIVLDMECNIFGHICPVVFVGEAITETQEERRRGRYIAFQTKMRVVRRDNYTCQHCGKHLKDDEVEFDHIIPDSKGGSVAEHNIRLTCFDCNRDKADSVVL